MYAWRQHVETGGLMAYAVDLADVQPQTGRFVDEILKGTRPTDLPVEQPTKVELVMLRQSRRIVGTVLGGANPGDLPIECPTRLRLFINLKTPRPSTSCSRRRCSCGRTR
jgi:ABC-type uncharacterized transport system substrate-binding protein